MERACFSGLFLLATVVLTNAQLDIFRPKEKCILEYSSGDSDIGFSFPQAIQIIRVVLDNVHTPLECLLERGYGINDKTVWVRNGCETELTICFTIAYLPIPPRIPIASMIDVLVPSSVSLQAIPQKSIAAPSIPPVSLKTLLQKLDVALPLAEVPAVNIIEAPAVAPSAPGVVNVAPAPELTEGPTVIPSPLVDVGPIEQPAAVQTDEKCLSEWVGGDIDIEFQFPHAREIVSVTLDSVRRVEECVRDATYGVKSTSVWVIRGCQGRITICYIDEAISRTARLVFPAVPPLPIAGLQSPSIGGLVHTILGIKEFPSLPVVAPPPAVEISAVPVPGVVTPHAVEISAVPVPVVAPPLAVETSAVPVSGGQIIAPGLGPLPVVPKLPGYITPAPPVITTTQEPLCVDEWSSGFSRITFTLPKAKEIFYMDVTNIEWEYSCILNKDYGVVDTTVWVEIGCKAEFEICFHFA